MLSIRIDNSMIRIAQMQDTRLVKWRERLTTALRINRASDDAGGLSMSESLRAQVRGSRQAAANIQNGINIVRIGIDGVESLLPGLQRMRELVIQAGNAASEAQAPLIQAELDEMRCLLADAFYVGKSARLMFDGDPEDRALDFQVGANQGQKLRVDYDPLRNQLLQAVVGAFGYTELYNSPAYGDLVDSVFFPGVGPPPSPALDAMFPKRLLIDPPTQVNIDGSLAFLDETITNMVSQASYLGAMHNRLEHELNTVTHHALELMIAESRIRDVDMAEASIHATKAAILKQGATGMVIHAKFLPELMLTLLTDAS